MGIYGGQDRKMSELLPRDQIPHLTTQFYLILWVDQYYLVLA